MSNNLTGNNNEKSCEYCGTDKTYMAVTKSRTPYPKWYNIQYITTGWAL
jgi:hypothetical protein